MSLEFQATKISKIPTKVGLAELKRQKVRWRAETKAKRMPFACVVLENLFKF